MTHMTDSLSSALMFAQQQQQQQLSYRSDLKFENTYQMGPPPPELLFDAPSVEMMLSQLLVEFLTGHKYKAQKSAQTAMDIVTTARNRLKALALPRYCTSTSVLTFTVTVPLSLINMKSGQSATQSTHIYITTD